MYVRIIGIMCVTQSIMCFLSQLLFYWNRRSKLEKNENNKNGNINSVNLNCAQCQRMWSDHFLRHRILLTICNAIVTCSLISLNLPSKLMSASVCRWKNILVKALHSWKCICCIIKTTHTFSIFEILLQPKRKPQKCLQYFNI